MNLPAKLTISEIARFKQLWSTVQHAYVYRVRMVTMSNCSFLAGYSEKPNGEYANRLLTRINLSVDKNGYSADKSECRNISRISVVYSFKILLLSNTKSLLSITLEFFYKELIVNPVSPRSYPKQNIVTRISFVKEEKRSINSLLWM